MENENEMKINDKNVVDYIIQWEGGEMNDETFLEFFSYLIKTGKCWTLQGMYGRMAKSLIDEELIQPDGKIRWDNVACKGIYPSSP